MWFQEEQGSCLVTYCTSYRYKINVLPFLVKLKEVKR